jgi:hypothetical protein
MHKAVSECGIPTLTDIDHIWAGPEGIWKNKILEHAHRKEISHDLFLLHQTTSDINFDNAFQLFLFKWRNRGENVLADHLQSQVLAGVITKFNYLPHVGFFRFLLSSLTQPILQQTVPLFYSRASILIERERFLEDNSQQPILQM